MPQSLASQKGGKPIQLGYFLPLDSPLQTVCKHDYMSGQGTSYITVNMSGQSS